MSYATREDIEPRFNLVVFALSTCTALHRHQELRVSIDPVCERKILIALCTLQGALGLKPTSVKEKRCLHLAQCFHIGSGASDPAPRYSTAL